MVTTEGDTCAASQTQRSDGFQHRHLAAPCAPHAGMLLSVSALAHSK